MVLFKLAKHPNTPGVFKHLNFHKVLQNSSFPCK
jgi:hypothetical protein